MERPSRPAQPDDSLSNLHNYRQRQIPEQPFWYCVLTGGYGRSLAFVNGRPVIIDETVRYWEISRQAAFTLAKPFSRAQRIEFSGGFQNISFDAEAFVEAYSAETGEFLGEQKFNPGVPNSLNLATGNAALVYDTSIFGGVSPILGQRYRFEIGMSARTLIYSSFLADYRRYINKIGPPASLQPKRQKESSAQPFNSQHNSVFIVVEIS